MRPRFIRLGCAALLTASLAAGCHSSSGTVEAPYPKDPLLLSKKPIEGGIGATIAAPSPPQLASAEPVAAAGARDRAGFRHRHLPGIRAPVQRLCPGPRCPPNPWRRSRPPSGDPGSALEPCAGGGRRYLRTRPRSSLAPGRPRQALPGASQPALLRCVHGRLLGRQGAAGRRSAAGPVWDGDVIRVRGQPGAQGRQCAGPNMGPLPALSDSERGADSKKELKSCRSRISSDKNTLARSW